MFYSNQQGIVAWQRPFGLLHILPARTLILGWMGERKNLKYSNSLTCLKKNVSLKTHPVEDYTSEPPQPQVLYISNCISEAFFGLDRPLRACLLHFLFYSHLFTEPLFFHMPRRLFWITFLSLGRIFPPPGCQPLDACFRSRSYILSTFLCIGFRPPPSTYGLFFLWVLF